MEAELCFGFHTREWKALSQRLDDADESVWAKAIGVFERRMRERFLSSIDALVAADTKPDRSPSLRNPRDCIPGFSIMALCCLLIDTLQGFRQKPPRAPDPTGPCTFPPRCVKPQSSTTEQFKSFLRRAAFGETFKDEALAKKFVKGIRDGILHEAETRKWVIWREEPADKIAAPEEDGFALNRSLFYAAVKKEFESYLQELRDPTNENLRKRFKKKMNDLCNET